MQTSRRGIVRPIVFGAFAIALAICSLAQDSTYPQPKPSPPRIGAQIVLLDDSVVQMQWTHTLTLINAPQNVTLLNPGHCVRVGVYSSGDMRDDYLRKAKLSFRVQFAGHNDAHPFAPLVAFKQIKPEGLDFVTATLGVAGIKPPDTIKTMASLAASGDYWCVPVDAGDGTATVAGEVETPEGRQVLTASTVTVESFDTGSKKSFKDAQELETVLSAYYRQPNSARLLPVLQFIVADQITRQGQVEIIAAFLSAALKSDPTAAHYFQTRITGESPLTRALGLLILRSAGYDIGSLLNTLSAEEQQKFLGLPPLQDPFDMTPRQELFQHLDMMWASFEATGELKPVKTVASALSWRTDYEDFDKLRRTPNHPSTLTPSIVRGVAYTAAGWSLASFQRNDSLVADYIEYLLASSDTPPSVRSELTGLSSNPAFKRE